MEIMQPPFISSKCNSQDPEAERLFQLGVDYHLSRRGMPYDPKRAEQLYEEALQKGNPKAGINLALLYRKDYGQLPHREERLQYAVGLLEKAASMGCPEALFALAEHFNWGWGVPADAKKAQRLVEEAAEEGSLNAMVQIAEQLAEKGKEKEAISLLEKSLGMGNGDAAYPLHFIYWGNQDATNMIRVLRKGASLGSRISLMALSTTYNTGSGQLKDESYVKQIQKVLDLTDKNKPPKPIFNFDVILPPKPIEPFSR